jgi:transcriptional regulator with XRE-family HTH domain
MAYEHLQNLLVSAGKKQADLARLINKTPAVVTNLFNGSRKLDAKEAIRIADWLGVEMSVVMGSHNPLSRVPIIGEVGAGGLVFPIDDLPLIPRSVEEAERDYINCEFIDAPPGNHPDGLVALRVAHDSQKPYMPPGTIVYYSMRILGGAPEECIGKMCVVQTREGATMLKIVRRGMAHGHFDLHSYNLDIIENVELAWCARVEFIKPI